MSNRLLTAYRHVLRATSIAFANDTAMLLASRQRLKQGMLKIPDNQKHLTTQGRVDLLEDIALYLKRNVVQGKRVSVDSTTGAPKYHLNIHSETQLEDN